MSSQQEFFAKIETFKSTINDLHGIVDVSCIQQTANRLTGLHFTPTLIFPTENFLYLSKTDILEEIDRVASLSEQELQEQGFDITQDFYQLKLQHIGLLVYHFKLLTRLRQDEPNAWDEINELYGDD